MNMNDVFKEAMQKYYSVFDIIREEHNTWFPVPDLLITKLIDQEIKRVFGKVSWKYDNAPKTIGDFGEEQPYGNYEYSLYKDKLTLIVNYNGKKEIENFDKQTKQYILPGNWLWNMSTVNAKHF